MRVFFIISWAKQIKKNFVWQYIIIYFLVLGMYNPVIVEPLQKYFHLGFSWGFSSLNMMVDVWVAGLSMSSKSRFLYVTLSWKKWTTYITLTQSFISYPKIQQTKIAITKIGDFSSLFQAEPVQCTVWR